MKKERRVLGKYCLVKICIEAGILKRDANHWEKGDHSGARANHWDHSRFDQSVRCKTVRNIFWVVLVYVSIRSTRLCLYTVHLAPSGLYLSSLGWVSKTRIC